MFEVFDFLIMIFELFLFRKLTIYLSAVQTNRLSESERHILDTFQKRLKNISNQ